MKIDGLQKLTLLDFPGHTACTVFTPGCNFRCPFCHNASLVTLEAEETVTEEEFFKFLSSRHGILKGVAVTGGEPTLQKDLPAFLKKVKDLGFKTKLDTNGYLPEVLEGILDTGLADYVAMDIKSSREGYSRAVGTDVDVKRIERSVEMIKNSGVEYEFRTTAVKGIHSFSDFIAIGRWLGQVDRYFIQQFKDSGDILSFGAPFSKEEMTALLAAARTGIPHAELRGME